MKQNDFKYGGHDLESMLNAQKYYDWIIDMFRDHIGRDVIEVGAGTGSFSQYLLRHKPSSLTLIEPSADMYLHLEKRVKDLRKVHPNTDIQTHNNILKHVGKKLSVIPDTIVYTNVMEHIEDDVAEMKHALKLLSPGGKLLIFVPALQSLLGSFDQQVGHFRRYSKKELVDKSSNAGFDIKQIYYADLLGVAPWWLSFRLLKRKKLNPHVVEFYDRFAVPFIRTTEGIIKPPIGKNLLLIAQKPV